MTNVVGFEARGSAERQAREWLVRLDGDEPLTPSELDALREWMGRSPVHHEELRRLCGFWKQANVLTELAVFPRPSQQPQIDKGHRTRLVLAVVSVVLASAVLGWWHFRAYNVAANGTYGTAIGQQQTIALPDGSSVQLNTDSQVHVRYNEHVRGVRLLRGEALFSVKRDPNRGFEVYVADTVVRAVGTAFAVHLEGSKVDVTVTKGVVEVADLGAAQISTSNTPPGRAAAGHKLGRLAAGQITTFGSGGDHLEVQQLPESELQRRMAWHDGYLVFSGEPLSQVVEQMNRYSPVNLQIGDPALASVAIGGRFRIDDLDAVLDVLHTNFGIASRQVDERNIRLESERAH